MSHHQACTFLFRLLNAPKVGEATTSPGLSSGFEGARNTLTTAFNAFNQGRLFRDPQEDVDLPEERIFIASWVDYCERYGMAYALTDGTVGVYFNDSTSIVLSPDKKCVI